MQPPHIKCGPTTIASKQIILDRIIAPCTQIYPVAPGNKNAGFETPKFTCMSVETECI